MCICWYLGEFKVMPSTSSEFPTSNILPLSGSGVSGKQQTAVVDEHGASDSAVMVARPFVLYVKIFVKFWQ
jgi:hypothetical protein